MEPQPGSTIGPYRIVDRLGAGGMGVVYKALDTRLQRHVAIKVLPAALSADAERRQRFLHEARAASALSDTHIVTVHDIFEVEGTDYLVMELLDGRTLAAAAAELSVAQVVDYVAQIADALALAHAAGIVHRDLKPANIVVTARGVVKVLDFGIAKIEPHASQVTSLPMTMPGVVMGTAAYMSPEQAQGRPVDHRTDIYALGVILHELLMAIGENRPALARVATRAVERDPEKRFKSMAEFAAALRAAQKPAYTAGRVALTFAAVVAMVAAGLWLWAPRESTTANAPATANAMPAPSAAGAPTTALEHTQQGLGLLRRFDRAGNVDQAISSFEAAISLDAKYAPGWVGLARGFWRKQLLTRDVAWTARARDAAEQAIEIDPYLADGHAVHGLVHLAGGLSDEARQAFDRALVLDPSNAIAHRGLGDIAESADDLATAVAHYERAMARDPADWELPRLLGDIPYAAGRYADAVTWYQKAGAAAPDSPTPHRLLGAAHHMRGDYPSAAAAFQQSLAIEPTAGAYTNLGTALFYQGRYRESLPAFERAREMLPSSALTWANLGDAYRWVPGNAERSREAYTRAVQLLREQLAKDPSHVANRSRLTLYRGKLGDCGDARAELQQTLTPAVKEVASWYRGAVAYEICGDRALALTALETALAQGYSLAEIQLDPELAALRNDVRYHQLVSKYDHRPPRS